MLLLKAYRAVLRAHRSAIAVFCVGNPLTREEDETSRPGAWGTPGLGMMSLVTKHVPSSHGSPAASGKVKQSFPGDFMLHQKYAVA